MEESDIHTPYDPESNGVKAPIQSAKNLAKGAEVLSTLANAKFIAGAVFTFFNCAVDGID